MAKISPGESFATAMKAYEDGRSDSARRLAKKLVEAHPKFGGGHYLLGLLALDYNQSQVALHHLDKAVELSAEQPAPRLVAATALQRLGRPAEAALHMRAILALYPDHAEAHALLGTYLLDLEQNREAVDHFRQALVAHPDWSAVLNNLGLALGHLGEKQEAVEAAREAVRIAPDHVGFRVNLAIALDKAGLKEEGVAEAQAAVQADPDNEDAWLALGMIHQRRNRLEPAMEAFAHAPDLPSARWSMAECLRKLGRMDEAAKHYQACLELDHEDHHGARLGLAVVTGQAGPDRAPEAYVRHLFDDFAEDFDRCLVEGLDYRGPALIGAALATILGDRKDLDIMDLGCGTGLAGPVLKPYSKVLDGLDLSPAMLAKARERALYDHLIEGYVLAATGCYDVAVAADVLVYIGELSAVMTKMSQILRPGGLFAFTVELADEGCDWRLGDRSRYSHSQSYIRRVTAEAGFELDILEDVSTRSEAGQAVPGLLAVAKNKEQIHG